MSGRRVGDRLGPRAALIVLALAASILAGCADDAPSTTGASSTSTRPSSSILPAMSTSIAKPEGPVPSTTVPPPPPLPPGPTAGAPGSPAAIGSYPVGTAEVDLVDTSRGTPANEQVAALDHRNLPTWIWYPAAGAPGADPREPTVQEGPPARGGRYPVVFFAHGVTGRAIYYKLVLQAWASAGYIVVAPDFPLSNGDAPGGPVVSDVGRQPGDVSFILDQLLDGSAPGAAAAIAPHFDTGHIAMAGHSLGAITALSAGFGTCCEDSRFDAVVDWAGALYPLLEKPSPDPAVTDLPLLIVHGDADGTVPYRRGETVFAKVHTPRWFITLTDGAHIPPYLSGLADEQSVVATVATLDFLDAQLKGDSAGMERMTALVKGVGPSVATLRHAA